MILETRHHLDLLQTLYVPYVSHNLFSLSKLDTIRYSFKFGNGCFNLFKHNHLIGSGVVCDGLYKLQFDNLFGETLLTLHHNITKRGLVEESSTYSWHKHLSHICSERTQRLAKNEIIHNLDFADLGIGVDCKTPDMS